MPRNLFENVDISAEAVTKRSPRNLFDNKIEDKIEGQVDIQSEPQGAWPKLIRASEKFNQFVRPLNALAAGVVGGVEQGGASLGNLALMPFTDKRIPYYRPENAAENPSERLFVKGGEVIGSLVPLTRVTSQISGALGAPSLAKNVLSGTLAGGALGGSEDNDLTNRLVSAAIGGAIPFVSGLRSQSIAKATGQKAEAVKSKFNTEYDSIINKLKNAELADKNLKIPSAMTSDTATQLIKELPATTKRSISNFKSNPTFESAHNLQSDLGKAIRQMNTASNKPNFSSQQNAALQLSKDLQKRVRGNMAEFLTKNKHPEILKDYIDVTKGYAKEAAPYLTKEIKEFQKGKFTAKDLVKKMQSETHQPGKALYYREIPGFKLKQTINELPAPLKYGLGAAAGIGGAKLGAEIAGGEIPYDLMDVLQNILRGKS